MKPPFNKVLIANRGEIALRIIRACRELGCRTVAIYSQADANALHVRFADESVCIGPAQALQSYLHQPAVLSAVDITKADAVHPGYGFLAENAQFAAAVRKMGRAFVGPSVEHLHMFGDKLSAKEAARKAGLPLLEGSPGAVATLEAAKDAAETAGYPVILKAAAGGGGKGMRVVESPEELDRVFEVAQAESQAAFGSADVFIERYLRRPRHVEVQVAGDGQGGGIHLGTRDCSMQRRHQKIIEEAPAPNLSDSLRDRIQEAAATLVRTVGYQTVATCEFLVEGEEFFFLEVNPRIQVEHPVTEGNHRGGPHPAPASVGGRGRASHPAGRRGPARSCDRGPGQRGRSPSRSCRRRAWSPATTSPAARACGSTVRFTSTPWCSPTTIRLPPS